MKVLILKPSSLGDVVQALPVLRLLKQHRPQAKIYWWIDSALASLLQTDPDLTDLILFERRRWRSPWRWPELVRSVRAMRAHAFDWVIDLQGLARSGLFSWLAQGRVCIGVDDPREGARGLYDYAVPRPSFHTHAVDWYLGVLPYLGIPVHNRFEWLPSRSAAAASVHAQCPDPTVPWVILLPGARWTNKRWPTDNFAELVRQLTRRFPTLRFALLGSAADQPAGQQIQQAVPDPVLNLTGRTSLLEMVEWIRFGMLTVSNDSGPMHVAAALGKPVVAIFGPTEPKRTGPYGQLDNVIRHALPCAPCLKDSCAWNPPLECLYRITVRAVFSRIAEKITLLSPQLASHK